MLIYTVTIHNFEERSPCLAITKQKFNDELTFIVVTRKEPCVKNLLFNALLEQDLTKLM